MFFMCFNKFFYSVFLISWVHQQEINSINLWVKLLIISIPKLVYLFNTALNCYWSYTFLFSFIHASVANEPWLTIKVDKQLAVWQLAGMKPAWFRWSFSFAIWSFVIIYFVMDILKDCRGKQLWNISHKTYILFHRNEKIST